MKDQFDMSVRVSVITICYNAEDTIEETIKSVVNQDYDNLEYIIVDGKSSDSTLQIIAKYKEKISKVISEKDNGIYHAMNKGVMLASGDWVNFMNSGDAFYENTVISRIFNTCKLDSDFIYGDFILRNFEGVRYDLHKKVKTLKSLYRGMHHINLCHQASFAKKELLVKYPFNSLEKTSSDFEFIYFLYKNKFAFCKYEGIVAYYLKGGFSTKTLVESRIRDYRIVSKFDSSIKKSVYYLLSILVLRLKLLIKSIVPLRLWEVLKKKLDGAR